MLRLPYRTLNASLSLVLVAGLVVAVGQPGGMSGSPELVANPVGGIGEKSVDATGAYRRDLPLRTPSFYGIEPTLRLSYSSHGGNGLAGTGWVLTGFPEIERTSPNLGAPAFDATDVFHLDGVELVRCAPTMLDPSCRHPAGPGQVSYATRSADYRRVAFEQPDPKRPGHWLVWDRDGNRQEFHQRPTPGNQPPTGWQLASTTDPAGHRVSYTRTQALSGPDTASYPATVSYGGVTVTLYYERRPDVVSYGDGRSLIEQARRLRSVDVTVKSARARLYRLSYTVHGTTGRSFLSRFEEFGSNAQIDAAGELVNPAAAVALPATTFAAPPDGQDEWSADELTGLDGLPIDGGPRGVVLDGMAYTVPLPFRRFARSNLGDIDGNGRTDWVQASPDLDFNPTARHTSVQITAAVAGRTAPIYTQTILSWPFTGLIKTTYLADVDADGRSDLVFLLVGDLIPGGDPSEGGRFLNIAVARSAGDGSFAWMSTTATTTPFETREPLVYRTAQCAAGDVDGDRRADLMCSWTDDAGDHHLGTASSNADGTWSVNDEAMPFANGDGTRDLAVGDTNGDRLADAMFLDYPACPATGPCLVDYELVTAVSDGLRGHRTERQATSWAWGGPTFFSADVNGDRRSDYVLFASVNAGTTVPGAIQTALTSPAGPYVLNSQPVPAALRATLHTVAVGDADGDAKADLMVASRQEPGLAGCSPTMTSPHVNLHRVRSLGDGSFDLPATWQTCASSTELDVAWDDVRYTPIEPDAGDLDGDGADDFIMAVAGSGTRITTLRENLSGNPTGDAHAWRQAEINGDGRADWVYPRNTPTGPLISTMVSGSAGGFTTRAQSPQPGTSTFTAQAGWRVADVNADGLDDLVYLRYADPGTGVQIGTWLANGHGAWLFKKDTAHVGLSGRHRDIAAWRTGDLNGDARADLVYVGREDSTGKLSVWTLRSVGDGTWLSEVSVPAGAWPGPDGGAWRIADLDGDGRHDLVHLGIVAGTVELRSLLSLGDGSWRTGNPATITGADLIDLDIADLASWSVVEANGDGRSDLVQLTQTDRGVGQPTAVRLLTLLGHGDGGFTSRRDQPSGTLVGDLSQWRAATVSPDGRTDLVHVRNDGSTVAVTTLRPSINGQWRLSAPDINNAAINTVAGGFTVADENGDGEGDLVRFDLVSGGMRALTVRANVQRDVIATVGFPTGGTQQIEYTVPGFARTGNGMECALPAGVAPLAVSALRDSAGAGLGQGQADFEYLCPRWSPRRRTLTGWEHVISTDGASTNHPAILTRRRYDLNDACPARLAATEIFEGSDFLRKEITAFKPVGAAAPHTCLVDSVRRVTAGSTSSLNSTIGFSYDGFGNVTIVSENAGASTARTTNISYAPLTSRWIVDRPWQVTVWSGTPSAGQLLRSIYHCYDGDNGTDQASCSVKMTLGRLTAIKLVNANGWYDTTTYTYDAQGNIRTMTDADGRPTTIDYEPTFQRFPRLVCDALAHCTTFEWDPGIEQVTATTDANNARTEYGHDVHGRLTTVSSPGGQQRIDRLDEGNPQAQRMRITQEDGTADGLWTESHLDGLGRMWQERAEGPTAKDPRVRDIGYDDAGPDPARRSHWHFASAPAVFETFAFDAAGRMTQQTHPDGAALRWSYTASSAAASTTFDDEMDQRVVRAFDDYDRTTYSQADPGGLAEGTTTFSSNAVDELTTLTDPLGNAVVRQLDPRGDLVALTDPDRGSSTTTYDRTGHPKQHFDQLGKDIDYHYDAVGRLASSELASGRIVHWLYDEPNHGHSAGQLTAITDSYGAGCPFRSGVAGGYVVDERSYDLAGRMTSRTLCVEGESKTFGFEYDKMGRQRALTYPDRERVVYHYDDAGQLDRIDGYATQLTYDAAGRITGLSLDNGISESFGYDPQREWLNSHRVLNGTKVLHGADYRYYSNGQLHTEKTIGATAGASTYTYDGAGRVTDVTGAITGHYEYDAAGDLTRGPDGVFSYTHPDPAKNRCGGLSGNTCPHAVKQAGNTTELTYDLRGNVTSISRTVAGQTERRDIGWNADGDPTTFSTSAGLVSTVRYDTEGQRNSVTSGARTTRSFGGYLEVSRASASAPAVETKSYYAGAVVLAQRTARFVSYDHHDALGSTRLVTDAGGVVQASYSYDAYGRPASATGSGGGRRYAGHRPVELGLIDMGARLYDPQLGRFMSPDPKLPDSREPRPVDPYSYANGDPINMIDPEGHSATRNWAIGGLGTGTGAGTGAARAGQPSQAELSAIDTWLGRPDPSTSLPTPLTNVGLSNNGGACDICHGTYVAPRPLTTGEKIAFGIVAGIALVAIVVLVAPEIAAAAAAVGATVTAVNAAVFTASAWLAVRAPALVALVMAVLRGMTGTPSARPTVADTTRMRLDYEIWKGPDLIKRGTMHSGPGGVWGHAEARFVEQFMGELGPEHDVILMGAHNMCQYGQCRNLLNSMAIMNGPNIFYWGYSFQNQAMLQQFISGTGIIYSNGH